MSKTWKLFGRDPAMYLEFFAALVMCAGLIWSFTVDQQSLLNAGAVATAGIIGAFILHDGQSTALLGGVKALLSLVMGFGIGVSVQWQTAIMMLAGAIVAMYVRTQATAPVPTPVPIALLKKAPAAIVACLLILTFNGCATTNPVVVAEKTYTGAFYTMDLFVHLEKNSRDMGLVPDPDNTIKHIADAARLHGREYVKMVQDATEAYKESASQANKSAIDNSLAVLNSLLKDINKYLPKLQNAVNKQKGTNATIHGPLEGHFVYRYERTGSGKIYWEPYHRVEARQSDEVRGIGTVQRGRGTDQRRPCVDYRA